VERMKESTLKRFFRLPRFPEHLELHRIDCLSSHGDLTLHDYAGQRYQAIPEEAVKPKLLVTGKDLIAAGYKPGPEFKQMLTLAEDAQLEGHIQTKEQGLSFLLRRFHGAKGANSND
jgi:tRNA nucleotidyltransferase/poly(A) polymerase